MSFGSAGQKAGIASNFSSAERRPQAGLNDHPKMNFFYGYIRQSLSQSDVFYTGRTENLQARLKKHNAGEVPHSAKFRP